MKRVRLLLMRPITLLLAAALLAAVFVFQDYGVTWDEPLFYKYADALGYAYSPSNWIQGDFDLANAYGPSGDDHKTRGPGYLLVARGPVAVLRNLGIGEYAAWHLANFVTFLLGVYFTYRLAMWFAGEWAAVVASALFATQPLLWGHGFINPKDVPFMTFFAGSVWLGVSAADRLCDSKSVGALRAIAEVCPAAIFGGLASSNRVLGPLSGLLVCMYLFARRPRLGTWVWIGWYAILASIIMLGTWPYLWEDPSRYIEVFGFMADNPTILPVLFADVVYRANTLPLRYLPFYLTTTLTEFTWPLFAVGFLVAITRLRTDNAARLRLLVILAWILIPIGYALITRPSMYDGMRHFLFIIPPIFVMVAAGIEAIARMLPIAPLCYVFAALVLMPGVSGIVTLHPYEYAYFNTLVGGTDGAFRHYETEYWLTCYKEAVEGLNGLTVEPVRLFVHREALVAAPYAAANIEVLEERTARKDIHSGDFVLVNTRTNEDLRVFREAPQAFTVGRLGATFCVVKRIP